jgi:hypothetical protein
LQPKFAESTYRLRDLFKQAQVGTTAKSLKTVVPGRDVMMLRLEKQ